jgi:CHASE2 domain-containing sensor protein
MLIHIVVWKYRADVEQFERDEHLSLLSKLKAVIPQVQSLDVGFDTVRSPRSYDTGLVATFENRAGLDAYTVHPDHIKVAEFGRSISEHVASVDFVS